MRCLRPGENVSSSGTDRKAAGAWLRQPILGEGKQRGKRWDLPCRSEDSCQRQGVTAVCIVHLKVVISWKRLQLLPSQGDEMRFMYLVGQRCFSSRSLGLDLCCRTPVLSTNMRCFSKALGLSFLFCFPMLCHCECSQPFGTPEQVPRFYYQAEMGPA